MRIAVFGLGYVGCVTGACLAQMGHDVCGVDISQTKVRMINEGRAPLGERGIERLVSQVVQAGKFRASLRAAEAMDDAEVSLVCVGTPSKRNGEANLDYVFRATQEIGVALRYRQSPHTVAVRSTVPPGTMEQLVIPVLERSARKKAGAGFHVCFHPEFLRESPSCQLVKALVEGGREVKVYDPQVDLQRLIGANRAYVESVLPELPRLLVGSLDEALALSEVIVIAGNHPEFTGVAQKLKKHQTAIDLVGLLDPLPTLRDRIEGLCW